MKQIFSPPTSFMPAKNDPRTMYWEKRPDTPSTHALLTCEEFRHGDEFNGDVFLGVAKTVSSLSGALSVRGTARNISRPVSKSLPLRLSVDIVPLEELLGIAMPLPLKEWLVAILESRSQQGFVLPK